MAHATRGDGISVAPHGAHAPHASRTRRVPTHHTLKETLPYGAYTPRLRGPLHLYPAPCPTTPHLPTTCVHPLHARGDEGRHDRAGVTSNRMWEVVACCAGVSVRRYLEPASIGGCAVAISSGRQLGR